MKKAVVFLSAFLLMISAISCSRGKHEISTIESEIKTLLARQQAAWNDQNIEGFMEDYWKSEDFTFQSGNNRLHGWGTLLNRYKNSYSGENWGKLDFTDIQIKSLSSDYAYALGRYKLTIKDSTKEGLFTIILQKTPSGWKIIHDHSS